MKVQVRSITSLQIIPENDADRAILHEISNLMNDGSKVFRIQSTTWCEGQQDIVVGYDNKEPEA